MVIHLDTSFLVDAMREARRGKAGPARRWLSRHAEEALAVSVFVLCELLLGAELHAESTRELQRVRETCSGLRLVTADHRLPAAYASVCAALRRQGKAPATMDLLIGSTALLVGAPLLTANVDHFARIPGLRVHAYK